MDCHGSELDPPQRGSRRKDRSLGILTTRFVSLLRHTDGVLDLKRAEDVLQMNARQKRRLYDITNVLSGIGLIEKASKNSIRWTGTKPGYNHVELNMRVGHLKRDITLLRHRETALDEHTICAQQSVHDVIKAEANKQYAYVTYNDISDCFKDDTLLAIQAPSGTQLEVPIEEQGPSKKQKHQIHLQSHSAPIHVQLINTDSVDPMVVEVVPAPRNDMDEQTSDVDVVETEDEPAIQRNTNDDIEPSSSQSLDCAMLPNVQIAEASLGPSVTQSCALLPINQLPEPIQPQVQPSPDTIFEIMSSEMYPPLLQLSPPPCDQDFTSILEYHQDGLFDVLEAP